MKESNKFVSGGFVSGCFLDYNIPFFALDKLIDKTASGRYFKTYSGFNINKMIESEHEGNFKIDKDFKLIL